MPRLARRLQRRAACTVLTSGGEACYVGGSRSVLLEYADGEWIRRDGAVYGWGRGRVPAGRPRHARADARRERGDRSRERDEAHHARALTVVCGDALPGFHFGRRPRARTARVTPGGA